MLAKTPVSSGKEIVMEYLVVLAAATMIAAFALIIARSLPKT